MRNSPGRDRYHVTPEADADLDGIWRLIFVRDPDAAARIIHKIVEHFDLLARFPHLGRDRSRLQAGLRSFVARDYVIFYAAAEDGVEILRVLHGSRDIESVFQDEDD